MKIVMIESNEKILAKWEKTFSDLNYSCQTYGRSYLALSDFEKGEALPDLLIIGLDVPIMNGQAYLQAQINSFRFYKGPLLLVMPSSLTSMIFKTTDVNHHLVATEDIQTLVEKVEFILKEKEASYQRRMFTTHEHFVQIKSPTR